MSAQKNPRQCEGPHVVNDTPTPPSPWGGRWEVRMRNLNLFLIVASLILAAAGIGILVASTTTIHRATTVVGPR